MLSEGHKTFLKVNFTLWEVNFQCTNFHLVPCRKEFCKEYSEIGNSSFIGEHFITEARKWEIRFSSLQAIMLYNFKNDDYYQNFKDPKKWPFYSLSWKQISIINTLFIKLVNMLNLSPSQYNPGCIFPLHWWYPFIPIFIHSLLNWQIFTNCPGWQRSVPVSIGDVLENNRCSLPPV